MAALSRLLLATGLPIAVLAAAGAMAQGGPAPSAIPEARRALAAASREGNAARLRAERLEAEARRASAAADKTAREAAALAARIQETQAEIAGNEARLRLIEGERARLRARLAERQRPVVHLMAALQQLSRRPPVLGLLRPGSLADTMHTRALLDTMIPEVERRTAALRAEIERARALERQMRLAARRLRQSQGTFEQRRATLAALETRQRLAEREMGGIAAREAERALAMGEQARDLGDLIGELGRAGALREQLAQLPGPVMRPVRPGEARVALTDSFTPRPRGLGAYMLPVSGRLVTGFGEIGAGTVPSRGVTFATGPRAQAISPAPGRVAFAGPYRGYGNIVIVEHEGGWTSLVTGLAQLDTRVGAKLLAGSPLGIAGPANPVVTVELRRDGEPVNPLQFVPSL